MKVYRKWRYSFTVLNLDIRWSRAVSFTPLLLYPQGRRPRYPLHRRLGRSQNRSDRYGEEKKVFPGIETPLLGRPAYSIVALPTELLRTFVNTAIKNLGSINAVDFFSSCRRPGANYCEGSCRTLRSLKKGPRFNTRKWSKSEQIFGHGCRNQE